eukprot:jgi/Psemu1/60812/gm1.60812_g
MVVASKQEQQQRILKALRAKVERQHEQRLLRQIVQDERQIAIYKQLIVKHELQIDKNRQQIQQDLFHRTLEGRTNQRVFHSSDSDSDSDSDFSEPTPDVSAIFPDPPPAQPPAQPTPNVPAIKQEQDS